MTDANPDTTRGALDACFLGPYGENDTLLEKLVVEFLREMCIRDSRIACCSLSAPATFCWRCCGGRFG